MSDKNWGICSVAARFIIRRKPNLTVCNFPTGEESIVVVCCQHRWCSYLDVFLSVIHVFASCCCHRTRKNIVIYCKLHLTTTTFDAFSFVRSQMHLFVPIYVSNYCTHLAGQTTRPFVIYSTKAVPYLYYSVRLLLL
jgi:hypothetical protein